MNREETKKQEDEINREWNQQQNEFNHGYNQQQNEHNHHSDDHYYIGDGVYQHLHSI